MSNPIVLVVPHVATRQHLGTLVKDSYIFGRLEVMTVIVSLTTGINLRGFGSDFELHKQVVAHLQTAAVGGFYILLFKIYLIHIIEVDVVRHVHHYL